MLQKIPNNIFTRSIFSIVGIGVIFIGFYINDFIFTFQETDLSILGIPNFKSRLVDACIVLCQGIVAFLIFKHINNNYKFVENADLQILYYTIIGIFSANFYGINLGVGFGLLFMALSLSCALKVYNQKNINGILFLSGFYLGLGGLFFMPVFFGAIFIFLTTAIFRPFSIKNYLIIVISVTLPLYYLKALSYLLEFEYTIPQLNPQNSPTSDILLYENIAFFIYVVLASLSILMVIMSRSKFIVRQRNQLIIIITYIVIISFYSFLVSFSQLIFFSLPILAWFVAHLHKSVNKPWIIELFGLLLFIGAIWVKL